MTLPRSVLLGALLALTTACGGDAGSNDPSGDAGSNLRAPVSASTVRDSAGIRIVESTAPRWSEGDGWRVAEQPDAVLEGTGDPEFALFRVGGLALLPDGAVAVANGGSGEIAVLEADGRLRATYGRAGEGPGEFEWLNGVLVRGDTLVGVDGATLRLSLFTPAGELARELRVPAVPGSLTGIRAVALGDTGVGLFREVGFAEKLDPGVLRLPGDGLVMDWHGEVSEPLTGAFPGGSIFVTSSSMGTLPWGADLHLAGGASAFAVGDGAAPRIRIYTPEGRLERIVAWNHPAREIDEALREAFEARERESIRSELESSGLTGGALDDALAKFMSGMEDRPFPARLPHFDDLLTDESGHLWVRRSAADVGTSGPTSWQGKSTSKDGLPEEGGARHWWLFAPDGAWLGTVGTPPGLRVMAVTGEAVWGVHRDELGVETVRRHRLTR